VKGDGESDYREGVEARVEAEESRGEKDEGDGDGKSDMMDRINYVR